MGADGLKVNNDVVGVLLDDDMPPERLGELLRAARKRRGWRRREAAAQVGIEPGALRAFEAGMASIPADVLVALADCYGEDLTAHVPLRVPISVENRWMTAQHDAQLLRGTDEESVLSGYAQLLTRLRRAKPGESLALRESDLAVLSDLLGHDEAEVEARIVALLGCSEAEAAALRASLLRRKVILPVAGLAAGAALFAAAQASAHNDPGIVELVPQPEVAVTATEAPAAASSDDAVLAVVTPDVAPDPVNLAPIPETVVAPPPQDGSQPPEVSHTDAPDDVAIAETPPPATDEDDTPIGLLPGEEFQVIEIGEPLVEGLPEPE